MTPGPWSLAIVFTALAWLGNASADPAALLRGLDTEDDRALADAVAAIERAPASPELADVLFAAGRACEDRLHDPARALAIYERILRELPDAGVSIAAGRRAERLRAFAAHANEAAELARLVSGADRLPFAEVLRRGEALANGAWPGAGEAAVWLGDWLCRSRRFADAQTRYAIVAARWPDSDHARLAARNAAGCALDARDWDLAEKLATPLPSATEVDAAVRADLLASAARGRFRARLYRVAWGGLALAIAALLASLAEAALRGGARRPALRPPIEVLFLAPIAGVVIFATIITELAIAPAVIRISLGGLALAWVSGIALDLLRDRGRPVRLRAVLHVVACATGVLSIGYIAMTRDGLLDMLSETVRFGPGA